MMKNFVQLGSSFCHGVSMILLKNIILKSSPLKEFLGKGVLKICSKLAGEYPCRSGAILIKNTSESFFSISYDHFQNILRLFDVLQNFSFITSEMKRDYY